MNFQVNFRTEKQFPVSMKEENPFKIVFNGTTTTIGEDYNSLRNKPTLNGETIQGNVSEQDPTVPAWAKAPVKPEYSAEEVGAIPANAGLNAADLEYMWDTTEI